MFIVEQWLMIAFELAAPISAIAILIFFIWAFVGKRDLRARRLRISLASTFATITSIVAGVILIYFVATPGTMQLLHPEFEPPYEVCHVILSVGSLLLIFVSAGLAALSLLGEDAKRKQRAIAAICTVIAVAAMCLADWGLVYKVQSIAYGRYVMIESRDWMTHIGGTAPNIEIKMLDGPVVQLSELHGKIVLLNFFATWCVPCRNELPHVQQLWKEFGANDSFRLVVIGREETKEPVAIFKEQHRFSFPMAIDPDATAFHKFAKDGIPRTYLISRDGTILFQSIGFGEDNDVYKEELKAFMRQSSVHLLNDG